MKKHSRFDLSLLILAGLGLLLTIWLFPQTYPQAGFRDAKSREEIIRQAENILDHLQIPREGLEAVVDFRPNRQLIAFAQVNFGAAEANRMFSRDLPAFFWNVRYGKPSLMQSLFSGGASEEQIEKALEQHIFGEMLLQFDLHGRLLTLDISAENASDTSALNRQQALSLVFKLVPFSILADTSGLVLEKLQVAMPKKRLDYMLAWKTPAPMVGLSANLEAKIQGARVHQWQMKYSPLIDVYRPNWILKSSARVLAILVLMILLGVFFFKKLRADEMSLKAGLPAAIAAAISIILFYVTDTTMALVGVLAASIFAPAFIMIGFVILYGTGESLMRNLGHNRLLSFEAAQHGRWWFQPVGDSLWRGSALGLFLFGSVTLILHYWGPMAKAYFDPQSDEFMPSLTHYTAVSPFLSVWGENFCYMLFSEVTYRLFLISALARFFRQAWIIAAVAAFVSAMYPIHLFELAPFHFAFVINFLIGLALAIIYLRFDFLTTVTAALVLPLLLHGCGFLYAGKIVKPFNSWALLALPLLFIVAGQIIRRFGRTEIDTRVLQPDYLDRLAEKERIKRELEIARQVQLSFLPRQLPKMAGLDIAALCIPANEVGGDYYDFVKLNDNRLGVLIGDVSGKGVSAAFYMTLTKGIIKSSVQDNLSPAQVLIRANQLFYENVDRGIFVSLIYGVFDLEKRVFTSARAGHNPILLLRRQQQNATFVSSQGLALGLDHGEIFSRNIQEQTQVLNHGDVFVFYTDGFTEAMNEHNDEFGESRMIEALSNGIGQSSHDTLKNLRNAVQIFAGDAHQHDDMTMVVVKIL